MTESNQKGASAKALLTSSILLSLAPFCYFADSAYAQAIVSDGTTNTQVVSSGFDIDILGGTLEGTNLFHNFESFSTEAGTPTYFWLSHPSYAGSADGVTNIISQVTGDTVSDLNGRLRILGGNRPNLFLLNPNGIVVGPDAVMTLPGSLFLSTGESVVLGDANLSASSELTQNPLLSVSVPVGIQFGQTAAPINVEGTTFNRLRNGSTMTLLGGDINLTNTVVDIPSGQIQLGSVAANTRVNVAAGSLSLTYTPDTIFQDIQLENVNMFADSYWNGTRDVASGTLSMHGRSVGLESSGLYSDNWSTDDGGLIEITASGQVDISNSAIFAYVLKGRTEELSQGRGSNIFITADEFAMGTASLISTSTRSSGASGDITIQANNLSLIGSEERVPVGSVASVAITADTESEAQGGSILLLADNKLTIRDDVFVGSISRGGFNTSDAVEGDGGDILLAAAELAVHNGVYLSTGTNTRGDAGDLTIRADHVTLDEQLPAELYNDRTNLILASDTFSEGDSGDLSIEATTLSASGPVIISASSLRLSESNSRFGDGGQLTISVDDLRLVDGPIVTTASYDGGNSGDLLIDAKDITLSGQLNTDQPESSLDTLLLASTFGRGQGGDLKINAETLTASGNVLIGASAYPAFGEALDVTSGAGGNLALSLGQLQLQDGAQVRSSTFGSGDAGSLIVAASESIDIAGVIGEGATYEDGESAYAASGLYSSTEEDSTGNGGQLSVVTPSLRISDGAKVVAGTNSYGNAGSISIRANDISVSDVAVDDRGVTSGIVNTVSSFGEGDGGQIDIVSDRIYLFNGGSITASTEGLGNAGDINIQTNILDIATDSTSSTEFSGVSSLSDSEFNAGSVTVTGRDGRYAERISLHDNGSIEVSNYGGGQAGNIQLSTTVLSLNAGLIKAESSDGAEGNITIDSSDVLLLRNGSLISANASETATGGNITLRSPLMVGAENSDITANAEVGNGGTIQLTTQGLIGLALRDRLTPGNDITASSESGTNGTVNIQSPNVDPDSALVQLSENLTEVDEQVAAACSQQAGNYFVTTGPGGLASSPFQLFTAESALQDLGGTPGVGSAVGSTTRQTALRDASTLVRAEGQKAAAFETGLQEAGQWQRNAAGEIELLATGTVENTGTGCLSQISPA